MNSPARAASQGPHPLSVRARNAADFVVGSSPCRSSFEALELAYRPSGGLLSGLAFSHQLKLLGAGCAGELSRRLAAGEMFGWAWQGELWLPLFQVVWPELAVRPSASRVLAELRGVFDDWSLAQWFVQPSAWLRGQRPVDQIATNPGAVLLAARGDRVIAGP
jgi:hypothetical protein